MSRTLTHRSLGTLVTWSLALVLLMGPLGASAAPAPTQPPAQPLSLQQLFRDNSPAVVLIQQFDRNGKWTSLGSGFVVLPIGVIVTNNHVIAPDQNAVHLTVKLPRGDIFTDVRVIYTEARRDFAVLSIKASGLPTIKVGDSDQVEVGDQVVAIGNPEGLELTFTQGIVENVRTLASKGYRFIQHQAPISHGSSGGPLLNMRGEVIGINTFSMGDEAAQNLNGAIPINYVKPYFRDTARMTWEEYARAGSSTSAAPSTPAAPSSPPPSPATPGPAAPPRPATPPASGFQPGTTFERVSIYRSNNDSFKTGFAEGVYDTVSMFGATAQRAGGVNNQEVVALFQCLDGKGDKLDQLSGWMLSVVNQASTGGDPVVSAIARACQRSFSPGQYFEHISDFRSDDDSVKAGFAAGVYDMVSVFAAAAQGAGGIDNQKAVSLLKCLDGKGDRLSQLKSWVDSAVARTSADDPVVLVVVDACQP